MKALELRKKLEQEGFDQHVYSVLGGELRSQGLRLTQRSDGWAIEYWERGPPARVLETYASEEAACNRMYEMMHADFNWARK